MPHVLERASTGRAKCRACGGKIAAAEWRLGERVPNPFGDDGSETTHWFHPACGAFTRPEAFLEAVKSLAEPPDPNDVQKDLLEREATLGVAHHRLPRVRGAERAPTGRATCRACKALIDKGAWRIGLAFYEDGRFSPSGFIHIACASGYLETSAILPRLRHFSSALSDAELQEIEGAL
jgi:hypothetical protein